MVPVPWVIVNEMGPTDTLALTPFSFLSCKVTNVVPVTPPPLSITSSVGLSVLVVTSATS